MSAPHWIEPPSLRGYRVSRATVELTDEGRRHGCPEPALGRNEAGELAFWIRPIDFPATVRVRIEGLRNFFR